jgi:hypothetical protein
MSAGLRSNYLFNYLDAIRARGEDGGIGETKSG